MPKGSGADPNNSSQESDIETTKETGQKTSQDGEEEPRRLDGPRPRLEVFSVTFNVGDVKVDEMTVKVKGGKLSVSGQHVENRANGFCFHSFTGEFTLPPDLDEATLIATLAHDRTMRIEGYRAAHIDSSSQTDEGSEARAEQASRKRAAHTPGHKVPDAKRQQLTGRRSSSRFTNRPDPVERTKHMATEHICSTTVTIPQKCRSKVNCSIRSTISKTCFSPNPRKPKIDMTLAFPVSEVQPFIDSSRQPTVSSLPDTWLQNNMNADTNNNNNNNAPTTPVPSTLGLNITETPEVMKFEPVNVAGKSSCTTVTFHTFNLIPSPSETHSSTIIPISSTRKK